MFNISVKIDDKEVRNLLKKAPGKVGHAIRGWLTDVSRLVLRELTVYPPEPPESKYDRTLTLERSWSADPIQGAGVDAYVIVGSNSNEAPYNRFVQDETMQARIHAGRWTNTAQNVAKRNQGNAMAMLRSRLKHAFD